METTLFSAALGCLLLALVGVAASFFGADLKVAPKPWQRILLGLVGIALGIGWWVVHSDNARKEATKAAEAAYRQQVVATCNRLTELNKQQWSADVILAGVPMKVRKSALLREMKTKYARIKSEHELLWQRPVPPSLADKQARAKDITTRQFAHADEAIARMEKRMPATVPMDRLGEWSDVDPAMQAEYNAALSALADQNCAPNG
ncbi:hypothetical protein DMH04_32450 [Kibdelosporangium aridum]|uniref:Uncharacterized protein n=1 Tax=Kibdelosporangium aridum TaxID=2030 RepID=A0A428Z1R4_KIBAR|nr:hypothetical protein [Kibdelosporangium aridum]RSM78987.1 hypothetical protein DMH04_32450 [Kibdelosporangium aridum]